MSDFTEIKVLHWGLCDMHVCAPSDWDEARVERAANIAHPSGVTPWQIKDPPNGDPRKVTCAHDPKKSHYLLVC